LIYWRELISLGKNLLGAYHIKPKEGGKNPVLQTKKFSFIRLPSRTNNNLLLLKERRSRKTVAIGGGGGGTETGTAGFSVWKLQKGGTHHDSTVTTLFRDVGVRNCERSANSGEAVKTHT